MRRLVLVVSLAACTPGREAVEVPVTVLPSPVAESSPWGLTSAKLRLDAVRFRTPVTSSTAARWRFAGLVPTAHAHPGHDPDSDVAGEWLGPVEVDLLAGTALGPAVLYEGEVATADLVLGTPRLSVEGTYDRGTDALPVAFSFTLDGGASVIGTSAEAEVAAAAPPDGLALTLALQAALADIASYAPAEGPWTITDDGGPAANTLAFALLRPDHWSWETTP